MSARRAAWCRIGAAGYAAWPIDALNCQNAAVPHVPHDSGRNAANTGSLLLLNRPICLSDVHASAAEGCGVAAGHPKTCGICDISLSLMHRNGIANAAWRAAPVRHRTASWTAAAQHPTVFPDQAVHPKCRTRCRIGQRAVRR